MPPAPPDHAPGPEPHPLGRPSATPQQGLRVDRREEPAPILAPVSLGELVDKITILDIKNEKLQGYALANVQRERQALRRTLDALPLEVEPALVEELRATNASLWSVEDALREHERRQDFGEAFVELARSVYRLNDRRAALKKRINLLAGSALIEEKSYAAY